jgi:hypothetical protein
MIIFTIHQPSATMLSSFDHIYALCDGNCIYQGTSSNLIKFLDELELPCPPTYNTTDYLMEIANNEYGDHNELLVNKISNGLSLNYTKKSDQDFTADIFDISSDSEDHSASYFRQVYYLTMRTFLCKIHNKSSFYPRILSHILIGISLGIIFQKVGNDAAYSFDNLCLISGSITIIFYTSFCSLYMSCKYYLV